MHDHKTILALILARGGSKRLPGKNIKPIGGKPMIAWTIEAAKESKYVDRVLVSTDSDEIVAVAKTAGADVPFKRPAELASDTATSVDAVLHALQWIKENEGKTYDYTILLQPTSPLMTSRHLNEAIEKMMSHPEFDAVHSFYLWEKKPDWVYTINQKGFLEKCLEVKPPFRQTTQFFMPNGAIYVIKTDVLLKEKTLAPQKLGAYTMDRRDSADIDTQEDFDLAELLLKQRNH